MYIGISVSPEDSSYLRSDSVVDLSLQSLLNSRQSITYQKLDLKLDTKLNSYSNTDLI